jgi:Uma2 family endonuclease
MSPKGVPHEDVKAWLVRLVIESVSVSVSYQLRIEAPLPIGEGWVPEPDFALARRRPPGAPHPGHADWVCEIADTSLRRDREVKRVAFARYGVPEFWLIDVNAPSIEVFRHPAGEDFGHRSVHRTGRLVSSAVEGLAVDLDQLWRETLA